MAINLHRLLNLLFPAHLIRRRQLELVAAVGDGTDRVSRSHLPAELADDVDHGRAAVLRELVPYGLVNLLLCKNPAGVPGQISQREELQVRKVERLALPLYGMRQDPTTGAWRSTYATFKRCLDVSGIWEYCGHCFSGETVERGTPPPNM